MLQALHSPAAARRPWLALVLGVLAVHAALILGWADRAAPPPGRAAPAPVRSWVQLLAREGPSPALPLADDPGPGRPGAPPKSDSRMPQDAAAPVEPQDSAPALPQAARRLTGPDAGRLPPSLSAPPLEPVPAASPEPGPTDQAGAGAGAMALPADAEPTAAAASGEPPPLYAARPPPAATLRYTLHYYGRSGQALLVWQPSGTSYALQLQGLQGLQEALAGATAESARRGRADSRQPGRPLIEQVSQGQLDANGLAPDRFTDRRRGRSQRAANFRRELGRIEFSGPSILHPAWPGAQDSLSWWVQLPAILAAAPSVPAVVQLFVVDAHGRAELWRFDYRGPEPGPAGLARAAVQHWQHEPTRPEGQRVDLWLDPAQGHWPVRLRLTTLRTGERLELQLQAIEPSPP